MAAAAIVAYRESFIILVGGEGVMVRRFESGDQRDEDCIYE
jgi:hypothetical protein